MKSTKSKSQLETELKILRRSKTSEGVVLVLNNLIRWGAIVLLARYGYLAIDSLAGQSTLADIAVNFMTNIKVSVVVSWTVAGGGVFYGLRQRKLRRDTVERVQKRNQKLEAIIDKRRTSSQLTPRGDTRPEDKL